MSKFLRPSFFAMVAICLTASALVAQRQTNRPITKPIPVNLKIRYRTSVAGQSNETVTMLKGSRERSEMKLGYGMDIINVTQCDLRRTLQISDKTRKYMITPMDSDQPVARPTPTAAVADAPVTRGGDVTFVMSSIDTGERKEMFGFTARHVKTSTTIDSSADACSPMKMKTETDGWYIDLNFGLNCELGRPSMAGARPQRSGCQDRYHYRNEGSGRRGYPLIETTTMYGPDGNVMVTTTKEVVELSQEPLDPALFDVPAGYSETTNAQELYGMPSMDQYMPQSGNRLPSPDTSTNTPAMQSAKQPGSLRVGVVAINNRSSKPLSTEGLRSQLIADLESNGIDAVPLNASSPSEADAEAKAKQCDFILYSDLTGLKTSAAKKLGGMFGRATGIGGIEKTEAKIEFKLVAVGETAPRLQSSTTAKEEGDEASATTAISAEARAVSDEVRKKGRG